MKATRVKEFAAKTGVDQRTVRAATEAMVVDPYATPEGSGEFEVHSQSGNTYTVDLGAGTCSCPDFSKREDLLRQSGGCKHQRRVRMAVGIDDVPPSLRDRMDPSLEATRAKFGVHEQDDDEQELVADGGREHADGCTDEHCQGLDADERRPELSFECWEVWAAEDHDWTERERGRAPSEQDVRDIDLERALVEQIAAERGVRR